MDRLLVRVLQCIYYIAFTPISVVSFCAGWLKLDWFILDLVSIPGSLLRTIGSAFGKKGRAWGKQANALEHTHFVCRLCPSRRRAQRDPRGRGDCVWNSRWNAGDFTIVPHFGLMNYWLQYLERCDLHSYQSLAEPPAASSITGGRTKDGHLAWGWRWPISIVLDIAIAMAVWFCIRQ
jgi:hypothetical protein